MTEASWRRLIDKIQENNVVPIVGSRLLVGADGQASLQARVATRLLTDCGKDLGEEPLSPFRELNDAVSRLKGSVDPQDLYDCVHEAICAVTSAADFAIPTPIRQLAQIADFRLFVTLTSDDLLARSLRARCDLTEIVHSPNLPTSEGRDLPKDWKTRPGEAFLLYLFGKSRSAPMFAIHDEDVLEYAHNLIARGSQVPTFLAELQQRNLLLIGCNFPEWLSRFFLRATNQKRLSEKENRAWLIDPLQPQESLTCFLRSYSTQTEILSQTSPADFIAELHQRWMAEHGAGVQPADRTVNAAPAPGTMFFISYSRATDLRRAELLYQALLKQGVAESEVWFDRKTIEPGEDFRRSILDGIRSCRYFLPLLSQAANSREAGFVFREWRAATDLLEDMNREFVLPVIVDADYVPERYTAESVRVWADDKKLDFGHAPEGVPDGRLETKLKKLVRESRRGTLAS
ncbi:MAG: toll/interleukin-1 receptor domain-containing protein [Acidobacteriota bacterium]